MKSLAYCPPQVRMLELLGDVLELAEPMNGELEEFVIPGDLYLEIAALLAEMQRRRMVA